jgi:fused signal recognition particle receptor
MRLLERLREGLARTTQQFVARFDEIAREADAPARRGRPLDVDSLEAVEELLLSADVGVAATGRILEAIRDGSSEGTNLRDLVKAEILAILSRAQPTCADAAAPRVILVVGVNGTGKTTTVGKLASLYKAAGQRPLVCAADTFRAAAVEQIAIWAARAQVDLVRAQPGADPASVVFDAIQAGRARGRSPIIVDTAGRLHTRTNLMGELDKVRRVAAREIEGAPHDTWLVLDATVGQNGLTQAREFMAAAGVDGIILTKLDGTAKGGIAVAIAQELAVPIRYVGVGESMDDLVPFAPAEYVDALFSEQW